MALDTPIKIELVLKNKDFITRKSNVDARQIQYKVRINNGEPVWVSRQRILSYLDNSDYIIYNAKKSGNSVVPYITTDSLQVVKLSGNNLGLLRKTFQNYLRKTSSEYISDSDMFCSNQLKTNFKSLRENSYLGINRDRIECVFKISWNKELNVSIVYTVFGEYEDNLRHYVSLLSKRLKDSIFYFEYLPRAFKDDTVFKPCNLSSTFSNEHQYNFYHGCYLTEYNANMLAIAVERKYFPDLYSDDLNDVEIKCLTKAELENYFKKFYGADYSGTWRNNYNQVSFSGFTYLKYSEFDYSDNDIKFLTAVYKNNVIGVIKFGVWRDSNHQAVSYIDVSYKYRCKGVATKLINSLEKYLYDDTVLVLTDESDMGKLCGMNEKFRKAVKKVKVKTYSECLRDGHYR